MFIRVGDAAQPIAALATTTPIVVRWPLAGRVLGLWMGTLEATVLALASLEVSLTDTQGRTLVSDTVSGDPFVSVSALLGPTPDQVRWLPFGRQVRTGDAWTFRFRNNGAGGLAPITPQLAIEYARGVHEVAA